ncbi:TetR-like C-terminal domain-containing protein [Nocardia sp. CA-135953]|uniref:TetR-like C-terminal domain-containing protein n=1 Tax=Nocardia sp. CA-135953 TaxID=3239978 RepID=UPI003D9667DD
MEALDIEPGWDAIVASGSAREQLIQFGVAMLEQYLGPHGGATLRVFVEAEMLPDLFQAYRARVLEPALEQMREIVERGVSRGELPPDADYREILDLLHGVALSRMLLAPHVPVHGVGEVDAREVVARIVDRLIGSS